MPVKVDADPLDRSTGYRIHTGHRAGQTLTISEFITWLTEERGLVHFVRPYRIDMPQPDVWLFITKQIWMLCSGGGVRYWEPLPDTVQGMYEHQLRDKPARVTANRNKVPA